MSTTDPRDVSVTQTLISATGHLWNTKLDIVFKASSPAHAKYIVTQRGPNDYVRCQQSDDMETAIVAYNVACQEAKDKEVRNLLQLVLVNGYVPTTSVLHDRIVSALN